MARRGRAELAVIITAQNEAAAVLKDLQDQVKDVERETKKLSKSTDKGTDKAKGLAGAWKSVVTEGEKIDKVRTRVDMLRSIAEFAIPIIGGLVAGVIALVNTKDGLDELATSMTDYADAVSAAQVNVAALAVSAGVATDAQLALARATKTAAEFQSIIGPVLEAQIKLSERKFDIESSIAGLERGLQTPMAVRVLEDQRAALSKVNAQLSEQDSILTGLSDTLERITKQREIDAIPFEGPLPIDEPKKVPKPPPSDGDTGIDALLRDIEATEKLQNEFRQREVEADLAMKDALRDNEDEFFRDMESNRKDLLKLRGDEIRSTKEQAKVEDELTTAIVGGALAATDAAIGLIDDLNVQMALRAIMELGLGFATLTNPVESVGHFTAAAILGGSAIAGAIGGGAGGESGGEDTAASEGTGTGGGGGGVTYIFNSGVVDGQGVQLALARADRSSAGTGLAQRRGV